MIKNFLGILAESVYFSLSLPPFSSLLKPTKYFQVFRLSIYPSFIAFQKAILYRVEILSSKLSSSLTIFLENPKDRELTTQN